jgi:hypothetical protein
MGTVVGRPPVERTREPGCAACPEVPGAAGVKVRIAELGDLVEPAACCAAAAIGMQKARATAKVVALIKDDLSIAAYLRIS